jgi:hypothetical protein
MKCRFKEIDRTETHRKVYCERGCGTTISVPLASQRIGCKCTAAPYWYEFGHWLAITLEAVGITPVTYGWLRNMLGLQRDCGCGQREESLNSLGSRIRQKLAWLISLLAYNSLNQKES